MKTTTCKKLALSLTAVGALATAQASPVTVNNYSFEAVTGNNLSSVSGWGGFGYNDPSDIGAAVGSANGFSAAPDGLNELYVNCWQGQTSAGIFQDVGLLQANTTYTLTVAIGLRGDLVNGSSDIWLPGVISLLNGTDNTGTVLATGGGRPATADTWQDYTVTFSTGALVSGDLTIMLSDAYAGFTNPNLGQADFDNVRLDATPVPEPGACALLGGGLALFSVVLRRRRTIVK
jgi:hypothetical protein